jgi:hypothetical protein
VYFSALRGLAPTGGTTLYILSIAPFIALQSSLLQPSDINKGDPISIEVSRISGASMLDQIVAAVREGQTKRAPIERVADVLTSYFVPFVTLIAVSTWFYKSYTLV